MRNLTYRCTSIVRIVKYRTLRWAGDVSRIGETRNGYTVLVEKSLGKHSLGRLRKRRDDNIKTSQGTHSLELACLSVQWLVYRLEDRGSIPGRGRDFFSSPQCPDWLWDPPSFLSNG
jgi:hypothetical protein